MIKAQIPNGYEVVNGRGPHLQVQFVMKKNERIYLSDKAFIFRHNKVKTIKDLEDLNIYPVGTDNLEIPENTIGFHIYGLQYRFHTLDEIVQMNEPAFSPKYTPTNGINISYNYSPKFIGVSIKIDNSINTNLKYYNLHIFKQINFNSSNSIKSITLNESLTKIYSIDEEYYKALETIKIDKKIDIINQIIEELNT